MTSASHRDHDVQVAIAGSLAVHLVLLSVLVWQWTAEVRELWSEKEGVQRVKEVTLLFPDQILEVEPPPPEPLPPRALSSPPQQYIRTTQNEGEAATPATADFISDRNTVAASEMAADPDGDGPLPTQEGIDKSMLELVDRDYKEGELMEDGATAVPAMPAATTPVAASQLSILAPEPMPQEAVESVMTEPVRAQAFVPPPPPVAGGPPPALEKRVELAKSEALSPMEVMMREMDEDAARVELNRLPLEVKSAETTQLREPSEDESPMPPELREPAEERLPEKQSEAPGEQVMPPVPKAIPVPDPVTRTAGPEDARSFSPFTRTSKAKGTLTNRGAAAVNAVETPVGRYMRKVTGAVEKRWHHLRRQNADAVTFGNLKLRFFVLPSGKVAPPEILSETDRNNVRMVDFTLQAILEAEIPPIPADLLPLLDHERLEVEYDVLIY